MATGSSLRASTISKRPMSVEQIAARASDIDFDPHKYSLDLFLNSADLMHKQASVYEHEHDDQQAYFLLYRHARLILDYIPRHPGATDTRYRARIAQARKNVARNIGKLEVLKPRINKKYEIHQERMQMRKAQMEREMHLPEEESRPLTPEGISAESPVNQDAAVALANTRGWHRGLSNEQDHFANMRKAREQLDRTTSATSQARWQTRAHDSVKAQHQYQHPVSRPSEGARNSSHKPPAYEWNQPRPADPVHHGPAYGAAPARPPKHVLTGSVAPPLPPKADVGRTDTATHFTSSAQTEGGEPLRPLFLPGPLKREFLKIAAPNTAKGIETCGMLCGTLLRNALFISHLVIPAQHGTSDTCEMVNEEVLHAWIEENSFEATDEHAGRQMMQLGWIHTHPTQTAFMSSADLHTHVFHQTSLPEYIAVVCAPRQPAGQDYRIFRMTDPPGLPAIRGCQRAGTFHPHENPPGGLYTDCSGKPGHVVEHEDLAFRVVDLRRKT